MNKHKSLILDEVKSFLRQHSDDILIGVALYPFIYQIEMIDAEINKWQKMLVEEMRSNYVRRRKIRLYINEINSLMNRKEIILKRIEKS